MAYGCLHVQLSIHYNSTSKQETVDGQELEFHLTLYEYQLETENNFHFHLLKYINKKNVYWLRVCIYFRAIEIIS